MPLTLGLMSGTSADGISAAIADFRGRAFKLLAYRTFPYPPAVRKKILRARDLKTPEISALNFELGELFASAALRICTRVQILQGKIAVIGSHGQTIYHGPRDKIPSTLQIGEAAVIAARTGIPVVSDFRPADIALGGEGAPLIPFFDEYFYSRGPVRVLLNIGGIANVTVVGRGIKSAAFDTGPGNCLMDLAAAPSAFDPGGTVAAAGKIDMNRIRKWMRHPYFKKRPPKSTAREEFERQMTVTFGDCHLPDLLATLTYFTALTIFEGVRQFAPKKIQEVIASGGGTKNRTLMRHLQTLFAPIPVRTFEEFAQIPSQAKEPVAFAFFALRAIEGKVNHLPEVTGARKTAVLGKISNPNGVRPLLAKRGLTPSAFYAPV